MDFDKQIIIYPPELLRESDSTSNFSQNENFVVLECVDRLLSLGYKACDLVLEKTWKLGHSGKSGRADITILKERNIYAIIECKTTGKEYNHAKKELFTDPQGNQLFSYAAQARSVEWLCLYASDFDESTATLSYTDELVKFKDDDNILHLSRTDKTLATFQAASGTSDFFETWEETYNKKTYHGLIFNSKAYDIGILPLYKKDLKPFDKESGLNIQFQEILRHNNISSRHGAFDILLAIFLAKCYDEQTKAENEELDFYYNASKDDYFSLYKRLLKLFILAMKELLNEEVYETKENFVANTLKSYLGKNRAKAQELIEKEIQKTQLYSAQFFNFKKSYNEKLFNQNGKILAEVVQLFENYRFSYSSKEQFLGELFETFLNEGFSQNEGVYFTPVPITRFVWNSLPFADFIDLEHKNFPKIIDFACGAGHFLTEGVSAISDFCKAQNLTIEDKELSQYFYGIDKDDRLALTSQITMLLNGASKAKIRFIDGLEFDSEFYGQTQQIFDILVANPPFSVKGFKEHLSKNVLRGKEGNIRYEVLELLSNDSKLIELAFVERLTHILKPNAIAAIILPSSVLSNGDVATIKAREILLENFALICLCSFGNQTFGTTGTNTVILFLRRFDEPPKRSELLKDSLDSIFNNENLEGFEDDEILNDYLALQGIAKDEYQSFLAQISIPKNELFKDYKNAFDELSEIKNLQKSSSFLKLEKPEKMRILQEKFFAFALDLERQKLKFFALTFKQKTLLVKAPDESNEQKKFLGFTISNAKNKKSGLSESNGLLSDRANRNAENKIAYAIRQSFYENVHLHEDFAKYLSCAKTCHLLDFSNANFNKAISLNPASCHTEGNARSIPNPFANSKFELVKLGEISKIDWGNTDLTKSIYKDNGKYLAYSASGQDGKIDFFENDGEAVILSAIGARCGKCFYAIGKWTAIKNTITIRAIQEKALTKFIFYCVNDEYFWQKSGSAQPFIKLSSARNQKIPLPPLEIQKQIVSECEKVEFQAHSIEALIKQYQNLIKAILVKCGICEEANLENSNGGTLISLENVDEIFTLILENLENLQSKLDFEFLESLACRIEYSEVSHQSIARSATESRPLRGAEIVDKGGSSASARLELEAEERGTPLDCRKSGDFFGVKGSGEGINPFLRKEKEIFLNDNTESNKDTLLSLSMTKELSTLLESLPTPPPNGWERKKLGELGKVCMCKRIMKHETNDDKGIPFYKIGTFGAKADCYISQEIYENYKANYPYPKMGQILISAAGTIGKSVVYNGEPAYFQDSNIVWIDTNEKIISNRFLSYIYQNIDWQSKSTRGGTILRLYNDNLRTIQIPLPPLASQEKIVAMIEKIESKISNLQALNENLATQKAKILENHLSKRKSLELSSRT